MSDDTCTVGGHPPGCPGLARTTRERRLVAAERYFVLRDLMARINDVGLDEYVRNQMRQALDDLRTAP